MQAQKNKVKYYLLRTQDARKGIEKCYDKIISISNDKADVLYRSEWFSSKNMLGKNIHVWKKAKEIEEKPEIGVEIAKTNTYYKPITKSEAYRMMNQIDKE